MTKCHVHEIQKLNKTSTSGYLTLPVPMYNQPSHEMKCKSMPIIFNIPLVAKDHCAGIHTACICMSGATYAIVTHVLLQLHF